MECVTVMVVVRDHHTEVGMMVTDHDHHTTVTNHRFPAQRTPLSTVSRSALGLAARRARPVQAV